MAEVTSQQVEEYRVWIHGQIQEGNFEVAMLEPDKDYDDDSDYDDGSDSECFHCGGEGWIDGYDDDPLWFSPGEMERCASCGGSGQAKDMTIW